MVEHAMNKKFQEHNAQAQPTNAKLTPTIG